MKREAGGPCLSALFVDYDNIYLSLKRKSEEAAKRFAKDAGPWLREIENGRLITPTNAQFGSTPRRIVMNRCYGNPVPRRNQHDNSTDMNSFPFVRHHFLRAGFEVIDCPPLTAQLKNSADIRMVMDIRDLLMHDTYFDEFIILSGDADFTPVLIRLRAHARRTVIFANDFTAAPYTAISDGEIRESNLIELILAGELPAEGTDQLPAAPPKERVEDTRRQILAEVVAGVRSSPAPVPLEALADRALRALGHEKTIATGWAGAGSFRELLLRGLPDEIRLTDEPPYLAFDARRHIEAPVERRALDIREPRAEIPAPPASRFAPAQLTAEPAPQYQPYVPTAPVTAPRAAPAEQHHLTEEPPLRPTRRAAPAQREHAAPPAAEAPMTRARPAAAQQLAPTHQAAPAPQRTEAAGGVQQSIARIQEACQAPPLAPPEYRVLFEIMAKEITDNDLIGAQTLTNITQRAQERGLDLRRDDVRFVLEVVSEADPWFEQGASANLFAGRFRNFVVARCRGQGLTLSADELDLIEAWFAGGTLPQSMSAPKAAQKTAAPAYQAPAVQAPQTAPSATEERAPQRWWSLDDGRAHTAEQRAAGQSPSAHAQGDEFPRIVRTRLRG
jgi:hypothetical protein